MRTDSMTLRTMLAVALATTTLGGCGKDGGDEFRDGVPYHEDVTLAFPAGAAPSGALTAGDGTAATESPLLGEKSELYMLTRAITGVVNTGTAAVLTLVRTITEYPPTSLAGQTAVWGPHTEPLSPNSWRLTVERLAPGQFHYVLEAKAKAVADAPYLTILSGHHNLSTPGAHRREHLPAYGSGDFLLDWDAAQMLPEHDDNVGKAAFAYSRVSPTSEVDIDVTFTQIRDKDTGMLIDATYGYVATPGAGGSFDFKQIKDTIATTPALETSTFHSRWLESGAGRSDVQLQGGDLGAAQATASECWSAGTFLSVYMTNSYGDAAKTWGAETACAFPTAVYSAL
jgi:hypothetical protein